MGLLNSQFPNLFGTGDEGTTAGSSGEVDGDTEQAEIDPFSEQWGWVANLDAASETLRCPWEDVLRGSAFEFLNILCYRRDKAEKDRKEIEDWRRRH